MFETIGYEVKNQVGCIKINREKSLNALNSKVLKELSECLDEIAKDNGVRVVIVTGAGDKAFVAGADISEMCGMNAEEAIAFSRCGQIVFNKIQAMPQFVIAAVNGYALGGGCELSLACDMRIVSDRARFGIPEVTLGVFPGFAGTQRLPRLVGTGIAKEMLATGRQVKADEAMRIGLANEVVEGDPMPRAMEVAEKICKNSASAIALGKQAMNDGMEMELEKAMLHEAALFGIAFTTADQKEGMSAFLEKRKADFK